MKSNLTRLLVIAICALAAQWQVERTFYPTMPRERAVALMANWERAVRQAVAV